MNNNNYSIIETKLAKAYQRAASLTIEQHVKTLKNAIANSSISINTYWIKEFLLGASSSTYQIEGGLDETSAYARFYLAQKLQTAGNAIDFFNRYKEDIKEMKDKLHINTFRLSPAWNRIEPEQGKYNQEAVLYYKNVLLTLLRHGIKPMVTFHHYDIPT
jgi:beta-glucosidase/6-phospho-beta-glucosidase/beta-galactosidase